MTQDGRWKLKYNEVMSFMEKEYRKLSKYYPKLDMHAKPFWQSCDVIRMNTTNKGEQPKTGCFPLFV